MNHRIAQIESTLQRAVAEVLQRRIADPRIEQGVVSVTQVKVSPDMREGWVYVSIMPESKQQLVVNALQHAAGHIQRLVGNSVAMRQVPRLAFRLDESIKKQAGVLEALDRAAQRTDLAPEEEGDQASEGDSHQATEADSDQATEPPSHRGE